MNTPIEHRDAHVASRKEYLDYAWKHFTVIADQRLKTFNFYIIIVAASAAATFSAFKDNQATWLIVASGVLHIVCATVFWLIDMRSFGLVNIPKNVLIKIEEEQGWRLFREDLNAQKQPWRKFVSYTFAFRMAFLSQCAFGLFVIVMAIASPRASRATQPAPVPAMQQKAGN